MKDYLNGDRELSQVQRSDGANTVGMVAWSMTLKTVEYHKGSLRELLKIILNLLKSS